MASLGDLGNVEYSFIAITPRSTLPEVVGPDRVLSMNQIEQTAGKQMTDVKLWLLCCNTWNRLTVCKKDFRLV